MGRKQEISAKKPKHLFYLSQSLLLITLQSSELRNDFRSICWWKAESESMSPVLGHALIKSMLRIRNMTNTEFVCKISWLEGSVGIIPHTE